MSDPSSSTSGTSYHPSDAFSFPAAFQPSIIRSYQKDTYYLSLLRSQVSDVVRSIFGSRFLQTHAEPVALLAGIAYYICSTNQGSQTLGEEYVGSRMVGRSRKFVSNQRRAVFVLAQVLLPFVLSRLYARLRRMINVRNALRKQALQRAQLRYRAVKGSAATSGDGDDEPKARAMDKIVGWIAKTMPSLEDLQRPDGWLTYATTIHLMLFYLGGKYYKFGQRLARVKYVSMRMGLAEFDA